jgi:hypothetical protein
MGGGTVGFGGSEFDTIKDAAIHTALLLLRPPRPRTTTAVGAVAVEHFRLERVRGAGSRWVPVPALARAVGWGELEAAGGLSPLDADLASGGRDEVLL